MAKEVLYKIALSMIPQVGPINARNLVGYCGGVEAVFRESPQSLRKISGIGEQLIQAIKNKELFDQAQLQLDFLEKSGSRALFFLDKDYPERLKQIKDAPVLLYYKGSGNLNPSRTLAIIGTRKPTKEGRILTEIIVNELKPYQVQVISGLAYGIDITAHRAAVASELSTIGIMGTGLETVYPAAHHTTSEKMLEKGGLLTEFPSGSKLAPMHFPMRNRIIAGMSDAVLVVESALKGGSMITAEMAIGYHKDVFAIPGRIQDSLSKGCNQLIKNQKAQLVESGEEIALFMQWAYQDRLFAVQKELFVDLEEDEAELVTHLSSEIDTSIDKLHKNLTWTPSKVASVLLNLEFKGIVKCLPGKRYILAD